MIQNVAHVENVCCREITFWSSPRLRCRYRLLYYRDADKYEVDVVIENAAGQLVGVEVKAAATVKQSDLRGLRKLASLAGDQFKMGILLYDGDETMPLGDGIWAAPLSTLWGQ